MGIAAEDPLAIVERVIDLELRAVLRLHDRGLHYEVVLVREGQARAVGLRIILLRVERDRIHASLRNAVAREGVAQK